MPKRSLAGLLLAACPLVVAADGDDGEPVLETVVVAGTRSQETAVQAALLDEETVEAVAATHPAELIVRVPGAWVSRGGGQEHLTALRSPVWTGPGSCGEIVFAEDGVPVRPSGFCNVNQFIEINTEQAGGMEVLRGSDGGATYGPNAVHGVFNVLSLPLAPRRSLRLEGGPYDFGRVEWQHGDEDGYLALNGTHDGGYQDSSGYAQQKLSWKRRQLFDDVTLTHYFTATHLDQQSIGYLIGDDAYRNDALQSENNRPDAYRDADAQRYVQTWEWQAGPWQHTLKPYLRHSAMDFTQHFVTPESLEENGHRSAGVQWLFSRGDFRWGRWQGGIDAEAADAWLREWQEKPSTPFSPQGVHYDYDVAMQTVGLWQSFDWQLHPQLLAQLSLRADRVLYDYDNNTGDGPAGRFMRPADRQDGFSLFAPRLGLVYVATHGQEWFASVSTANRAPQTAELYRLQGTQRTADIGEVTADGGEIGWRGRAESVLGVSEWQFSVFEMHKDNVIIRNVSNVFSDDAKTRHRGVEFALKQQWSDGWYADLAATYAEHRYDSDVFDRSRSVDANIMDTAPRTLGSLRAGRETARWRTELEWVHMGDYTLNPESTFVYDGHDLLNLRSSYNVAPGWVVSGRLMNVTNRDYAERADVTVFPVVEPRYFVGLPRALYLGLEWSY